ncbi:hypothetical protein CGK74_16890 [Thauera propionica]|uniref:Uncharacterized protein n=1 Tax=Thauera propionica TaxID=2019431 RepID=A0A235EUC2_9RHOO|nr:hypothetical protein [Thauera propionica]OYD52646.1 hypothetical protein CGK74_16890 [Thauera propionica]
MRAQVSQLLTPFRYLKIEHTVKHKIDVVLPLIVGLLVSAIVLALGSSVSVFGDGGYVSLITDLLQIMTGFYVAALAAVATFPSPVLDQPLDGSPAMLVEMRKGVEKRIPLTRRRFLSLLFGHLALLSICIYFIGGFASLVSSGVAALLPEGARLCIRASFVIIYSVVSAHLLVVTMLGLYYLSYRIHRPPSGNQADHSPLPLDASRAGTHNDLKDN